MSVAEAAVLLGISERQVKRLKRDFDAGDVAWVHHGNRGRTPANAVAAEVRDLVVVQSTGRYAGFNDSHLHEKLTGEKVSP